MKKSVFILSMFLCLAGFLFSGFEPANAQVGIKVTPVKIDELVDPGQVLTRFVKVVNKSSSPKTFYAYLRDFKAEGESGQAKLIAPGSEEGYYLASWINISSEGFEFGPNEEIEIKYTINVPSNVGPGGYFGAILFGTEPSRLQQDSEDKGAGMAIAQQTASLILLQVKGDANEEADIREFNTDKDLYSTPYDVNFILRIENTGNVHIKPHGTIKIKNMFGKEVAVIRVNDDGGNVLPGSIRRFSDVGWSGKNGFGRYTAELGLTFGTEAIDGGQGKQSLVSAKDFWIMPWKIIIPILLSIIFIAGLVILLLKLYKNKAVKKAMERAGLGHVRYVKKFEGPSPALHLGLILTAVFVVVFLLLMAVYFIFIA